MADAGESSFDNDFEKVPTAEEMARGGGGGGVQDVARHQGASVGGSPGAVKKLEQSSCELSL